MTGLVVDVGDTYCCIAPVVNMQVIRGAIFRLPFGGRDLREPENADAAFQCIYRAIVRSPAKRWGQLMARIVLSGTGVLEPAFYLHIEAEVALLLLRDPVVCAQVGSVRVRTTHFADCRTAVWMGASTIGAMAQGLEEPLLLENQLVALQMTNKAYQSLEPEALLDLVLAEPLVIVNPGLTVYPPRAPTRRVRQLSTQAQSFAAPVYHQGWLALPRKRSNRPVWVLLQGHQISWHTSDYHIAAHNLAEVRSLALGYRFLPDLSIEPRPDGQSGFSLVGGGKTVSFAAADAGVQDVWLQRLRKSQKAILALQTMAAHGPLVDTEALNEETHADTRPAHMVLETGRIAMLATLV